MQAASEMWYVFTFSAQSAASEIVFARVVPTDHQHHVQRLREQRVHCILPVLCGAANRVEGPEVFGAVLGAVAAFHRPAHFFADSRAIRARASSSGLATPTRDRCTVRVETRLHLQSVRLEELGARHALALDVVTHIAGLLHVAHNQGSSRGILGHLRGGGARFLVVVLAWISAVNPSFAYESTRFQTFRTDPHVVSTTTQPQGAQRVHVLDGHAERGQDHDISGPTAL